MFDFTTEKKEKYYKKAESYLAEHGLECFRIDRERFGYLERTAAVKIYLAPFTPKTVSLKELKTAKSLERFVSVCDRLSPQKKGEPTLLRESAYITFSLDEEDK